MMLVKRGNPFFLEESVRTLVETGALVGERGAYRMTRPVEALQVPATVQTILAARIDRLPTDEKQLLQAASVIGKDVPYVLLAAIAEQPEEILRRKLGHLQEAEFLLEKQIFPDLEYTFKHALTQEVAYAGLLTERRRAIHARIVAELERVQHDHPGNEAERLTHHAVCAELWEHAVRYGREAGAKALARWALSDARTHLEHARAAAGRLPESRHAIEQTVDVLLDLRSTIHNLGEVERGEGLAREAASLSERLGDDERIGKASHALSICLWMLGRSGDAWDPNARSIAIAESTGDALLGHQARAQRGRLHHDRGDYRQAAAALREALDELEIAGATFWSPAGAAPLVAMVTTYLGWSLAELGEFEEAARRTEALRVAEAISDPMGVMLACLGPGMVHVRQGNAPAAIPPLEQGLRVCHQMGLTALVFHGIAASLGKAYSLAHREAEAVPLLRRVADQAWSMKLVSDHLLGAIPLGEVWLSTGRLDDAAEVAQQSLERARAHGQRGHEAHALRLLAAVAARRDPPEALNAERNHFAALDLATALGMRPLAAHCHADLAKLYRETGKHQEAREHLVTATTMYREMGMTYWLEQAEPEIGA